MESTVFTWLFVVLGLLLSFRPTKGHMLDLTYTQDANSPFWPNGQSPFVWTLLSNNSFFDGWYRGDEIMSGTHVGTHLDAPCHFAFHGWAADEIPAERLTGPAVMVDIRSKAEQDPDALVTADDLADYESSHGRIPEGAIVFMCSGWTDKYGNMADYVGGDPSNSSTFHFPGFALDAAQFLVDERSAVALAVDTPSLDPGRSTNFPVHFYTAENNVYGLENVKGPCEMPASGATAIAAPAKIAGGSGAPVRILVHWEHSSNAPDTCNCPTNYSPSSQLGGGILPALLLAVMCLSSLWC